MAQPTSNFQDRNATLYRIRILPPLHLPNFECENCMAQPIRTCDRQVTNFEFVLKPDYDEADEIYILEFSIVLRKSAYNFAYHEIPITVAAATIGL